MSWRQCYKSFFLRRRKNDHFHLYHWQVWKGIHLAYFAEVSVTNTKKFYKFETKFQWYKTFFIIIEKVGNDKCSGLFCGSISDRYKKKFYNIDTRSTGWTSCLCSQRRVMLQRLDGGSQLVGFRIQCRHKFTKLKKCPVLLNLNILKFSIKQASLKVKL